MILELMQQKVRDWVLGNPSRGARELERLAGRPVGVSHSPQRITDELIRVAG